MLQKIKLDKGRDVLRVSRQLDIIATYENVKIKDDVADKLYSMYRHASPIELAPKPCKMSVM